MNASVSKAKVFLLDLGERAAKSFGQGAAAILVVKWTGLITAFGAGDWGTVKTIGTAAATGGLVAVGSLLTSLWSKWRTGTASVSKTVATTAVEQPSGEPPVTVETADTPEGFTPNDPTKPDHLAG